MKVSHECPISILKQSLGFCDYQYCLVHLTKTHPDYYNHYKSVRTVYNQELLLDNSIFELGKAFDSQEFYKSALDLQH